MKKILSGILPVLPTPYDSDNKIDCQAMESVVEFCIKSGANGLVFPGSASEHDYLSLNERLKLLSVISVTNNQRLPIIYGVGKGTSLEIIENIKLAKPYGITAIMILLPAQFLHEPEQAHQFMADICTAYPEIDIVLQNAPQPIGAELSPEVITSIIATLPNVKYIKEETLPSGARITKLLKLAPKHLQGVIGGGACYLIDEMKRGAIAAMPAAELTDLKVKIWQLYNNDDELAARDLYMRTLPMLLIQVIYRMRLTKFVLTARGVLSNDIVRAPLPKLDDADKLEVNHLLGFLWPYIEKCDER
ncbi:dihydrodipicolinate synthase family protein [Thalassotalea agariperforans]